MFRSKSRIEKKDGIRFYEQDVLLSNYLFTNDLEIELKLDYLSPGVGIVLLENNDRIEEEANDAYIIKVGQNDFTVINKRYGVQSQVLHVSSNITPPHIDLSLTFLKKGRSIELKSEDRLIGHYMLPRSLDRYKVGFYSNVGNTLKHASFISGSPSKWMTNIKNTNGGRVFFFKDGFHIENCINDAEVEQSQVFLEKGSYFLTYDSESIRGSNDIESFVFFSDDRRFDDKEKTLLNKNLMFELEEDAYVNIKFKGTSGQISNISLKNNTEDAYVPTDDLPIVSSGSSIIVNLDGLESVRWKGIIHSVPSYDELTDVRDYGIVSTKIKNYLLGDFNLSLEKEYEFILDVASLRLEVFDGDNRHATQVILMSDQDQNKLTIFRNIGATINQLIIKRTDGEEIDVLLQKTTKVYVPATIKGPIIVTDQHYVPLNLSSAYRVSVPDDLYLFTNWERELFDPNSRMIFEKEIIDAPGNIKVYGINKNAKVSTESIYAISNDLDTIDQYTEQYDLITEDLFTINYASNEIRLHDELKDKYESIVIDYQKENSYCINYKPELHAYEVDVSTSEETIYAMYDYAYDEEGYATVSDYQVTEIKPDPIKSKYIVLRKN